MHKPKPPIKSCSITRLNCDCEYFLQTRMCLLPSPTESVARCTISARVFWVIRSRIHIFSPAWSSWQTSHLSAANYVVKLQLKYFFTLQTAVKFWDYQQTAWVKVFVSLRSEDLRSSICSAANTVEMESSDVTAVFLRLQAVGQLKLQCKWFI